MKYLFIAILAITIFSCKKDDCKTCIQTITRRTQVFIDTITVCGDYKTIDSVLNGTTYMVIKLDCK